MALLDGKFLDGLIDFLENRLFEQSPWDAHDRLVGGKLGPSPNMGENLLNLGTVVDMIRLSIRDAMLTHGCTEW